MKGDSLLLNNKTSPVSCQGQITQQLALSLCFGHPAAPRQALTSQSIWTDGNAGGVDVAQAQEKKGR